MLNKRKFNVLSYNNKIRNFHFSKSFPIYKLYNLLNINFHINQLILYGVSKMINNLIKLKTDIEKYIPWQSDNSLNYVNAITLLGSWQIYSDRHLLFIPRCCSMPFSEFICLEKSACLIGLKLNTPIHPRIPGHCCVHMKTDEAH